MLWPRVHMMKMARFSANQANWTENDDNVNMKPVLNISSGAKYRKCPQKLLLQSVALSMLLQTLSGCMALSDKVSCFHPDISAWISMLYSVCYSKEICLKICFHWNFGNLFGGLGGQLRASCRLVLSLWPYVWHLWYKVTLIISSPLPGSHVKALLEFYFLESRH